MLCRKIKRGATGRRGSAGQIHMKETDIAYLAGIIDGEGTISFGRTKTSAFPIVTVTNTNKDILDFCLQFPGASLRKHSRSNPSHKPAWEVRWRYNPALNILDTVLPYLRAKRGAAYAVLSWREVVRRNGKYSPEERGTIEVLVQSVRTLNKRGV